MNADRLIEALFEEPDAYGECDGCDEEHAPLIDLPNCDDSLMFCRACFEADDHRGRQWRERLTEWWEQSKEGAKK